MIPSLPDTGQEWPFHAFPDVRKKLRVLDLFSGCGAFTLGLERTGGFETVAFCEIDPYARQVLALRFPGVPIYHDVRELTAARLAADGIAIDAICGGFPCTNVSNAAAAHGGNVGLDGDASGLWFEFDRLIGELAPKVTIIENVDSLCGNGLDRVLRCLAARRLDAQWDTIHAAEVGLPQARKRTWIVANPPSERMEGLFTRVRSGASRQGRKSCQANLFDIANAPFGGDDRFPQPLLRGVDERPANWMDRLKLCGNIAVPQIPELIGNAILASYRPEDEQDWRRSILSGIAFGPGSHPSGRACSPGASRFDP